jgi:hypothetical protein
MPGQARHDELDELGLHSIATCASLNNHNGFLVLVLAAGMEALLEPEVACA